MSRPCPQQDQRAGVGFLCQLADGMCRQVCRGERADAARRWRLPENLSGAAVGPEGAPMPKPPPPLFPPLGPGPPQCPGGAPSCPPGPPCPKPWGAPEGSISEAAPAASHSTPCSWAMSDSVSSFSSGGGRLDRQAPAQHTAILIVCQRSSQECVRQWATSLRQPLRWPASDVDTDWPDPASTSTRDDKQASPGQIKLRNAERVSAAPCTCTESALLA